MMYTFNDTLYALPLDYGPVVMFYNQDTFEKAGVLPRRRRPGMSTMRQLKKIRALGDDYYISNASGDIFLILSHDLAGRRNTVQRRRMAIWLRSISRMRIHRRYWHFWQKMIDEDLITNDIA